MKQYDKIYVPKQDGPYVINTSWGQFDTVFADSVPNVIVLTIEEAIEMWSAAERRDRWFFEREEFEKQNLPDPPDFTQYLTSKGIKLNP